MSGQNHESFNRGEAIKIGTERGFGLVFAAVFMIVALWPFYFGGEIRWWSLAVGSLFVGLALFYTPPLKPLNRAWFHVGLLLARVLTPVVMGFVFVVTVLPTGFALKLFRHDPLRLKLNEEAETYWIAREPPGPEPDTMVNQF